MLFLLFLFGFDFLSLPVEGIFLKAPGVWSLEPRDFTGFFVLALSL